MEHSVLAKDLVSLLAPRCHCSSTEVNQEDTARASDPYRLVHDCLPTWEKVQDVAEQHGPKAAMGQWELGGIPDNQWQ